MSNCTPFHSGSVRPANHFVRTIDEEATTIKVASAKNPVKTPSNGAVKLKKGASLKLNKPGAWKETNALDSWPPPLRNTARNSALTICVITVEEKKKQSKDGSIIAASSPSPVVLRLEDSNQGSFTSTRPIQDMLELQQCKHCKKGILAPSSKEHIAQCLRIKKEKAQRKKEARENRERQKALEEEAARKADGDDNIRADDDSDADDVSAKGPNAGKTTKKATGKKTDGGVSGKKRKAEGELDKGKAKKKKDEPKPKAAKPKGPVDVERQCGVILPNGQPCARSLTCKSHSMGAKRAVPGRSLPYDMLLAAYQKKNQAKQQKAAIDANAPLEEDDELNAGAVDSDEETAAVMSALSSWKPQPVVPQPIHEPIKAKYNRQRLHEQLQAATNGGRVNIFKVVGYGAQKLPDNHPSFLDNEDAPGEPDIAMMGAYSRRSSSFGMPGPQQRRLSVSSRV